jgi:hypothetical protein
MSSAPEIQECRRVCGLPARLLSHSFAPPTGPFSDSGTLNSSAAFSIAASALGARTRPRYLKAEPEMRVIVFSYLAGAAISCS